jgi:hypothetical protein
VFRQPFNEESRKKGKTGRDFIAEKNPNRDQSDLQRKTVSSSVFVAAL